MEYLKNFVIASEERARQPRTLQGEQNGKACIGGCARRAVAA